jgi:hypothetical protein
MKDEIKNELLLASLNYNKVMVKKTVVIYYVKVGFLCLLYYFAILTRLFHIPNTFIYMSFRAAQDHKATGRDMTLSMPS